MKTKTKIENWFEKWYSYSWNEPNVYLSEEIKEIKEILKELK